MSYSISIPNTPKEQLGAVRKEKLEAPGAIPPDQLGAASNALHKAIDFVDDLWPAATHIGLQVTGHDQLTHDGAPGTSTTISIQSLNPPPE